MSCSSPRCLSMACLNKGSQFCMPPTHLSTRGRAIPVLFARPQSSKGQFQQRSKTRLFQKAYNLWEPCVEGFVELKWTYSQSFITLWSVLISHPTLGRRLSWFRWLITYWDGTPLKCSPISVLTGRNVEQLCWYTQCRYNYAMLPHHDMIVCCQLPALMHLGPHAWHGRKH